MATRSVAESELYHLFLKFTFFFLEDGTSWWETEARVKKHSDCRRKLSVRSLSSVDLLRRDSQVFNEYGSGDISLHHRTQRRADSVVKQEAFCPKSIAESHEGEMETVDRCKRNASGEKRTDLFLRARKPWQGYQTDHSYKISVLKALMASNIRNES